jgi:hypothetical protein
MYNEDIATMLKIEQMMLFKECTGKTMAEIGQLFKTHGVLDYIHAQGETS